MGRCRVGRGPSVAQPGEARTAGFSGRERGMVFKGGVWLVYLQGWGNRLFFPNGMDWLANLEKAPAGLTSALETSVQE